MNPDQVCTQKKPFLPLDMEVPKHGPQDVVDLIRLCRTLDPSLRPSATEVHSILVSIK